MLKVLAKDEKIPYELLLLADETIEAIDKYIHQSDIYVHIIDQEIVAVVALQIIDSQTIEIKNIAVGTKYQGKGIGFVVLKEAIRLTNEKDFKKIIIGTAETATKQLYLYHKVGFERYNIKHNFFIENYSEPIFENGIQLKHMVMLKIDLS